MAAQWIRWNPTTHIFEYSTDNGSSFNPLPLNASSITEGVFPPAVIPGGSGASLTAPNTWLGLNTYSGTQPSIRFNETDAAAGSKNWEIMAEGAALYLGRILSDAGVATANLMSLDRGGNLTLSAVGAGIHNFNANYNGGNYLHMVNSSGGAGAFAGLVFQNDASDARSYVIQTSSTQNNGSFAPDALVLYSAGGGGILLNVGAAAPINFRTSNAVRMTIAAGGGITMAGAVTCNSTLWVGGTSTLNGSVAMNALSCSTINSNGAAVNFGGVTCGAITCTAINMQGYGLTTGGIANSGITATSSLEMTGIAQLSLTQINGTITIPANVSIVRVTPTAGGQSIQTINGGTAGRIIFLWNNSALGFTLAGGGNISMATSAIAGGGGILLIYDVSWRPLCSG
jgi:hypothetical protein